jgi:hypothetical protein
MLNSVLLQEASKINRVVVAAGLWCQWQRKESWRRGGLESSYGRAKKAKEALGHFSVLFKARECTKSHLVSHLKFFLLN